MYVALVFGVKCFSPPVTRTGEFHQALVSIGWCWVKSMVTFLGWAIKKHPLFLMIPAVFDWKDRKSMRVSRLRKNGKFNQHSLMNIQPNCVRQPRHPAILFIASRLDCYLVNGPPRVTCFGRFHLADLSFNSLNMSSWGIICFNFFHASLHAFPVVLMVIVNTLCIY